MAGNTPTMESLTQRLDRLEREKRRLKRMGVAVAVGIAAAVLMGQARPAGKVIEAEQFILRDASGTMRADLSAGAESGVGLFLFDRRGGARAGLMVEADGTPKLFLFDKNSMAAAWLSVVEGTPALQLKGSDGVDRAWLEVTGNAPRLVFRDEGKRQRLVLGRFSLSYTTGVTEHRPTSSLVLIDEGGMIIWKAP